MFVKLGIAQYITWLLLSLYSDLFNSMQQFKILPQTYILSPLTCYSKKRMFEEFCNTAKSITGISAKNFLHALNARESYGSTVCATGIAVPHALIPELDKSLLILAILQDEVPFHTVDTDYTGVDLAFAVFCSPHDKYENMADMLHFLTKELRNNDLANSFRRSWQDISKLMQVLHKLDNLLDMDINPPPSTPQTFDADGLEQNSTPEYHHPHIGDEHE